MSVIKVAIHMPEEYDRASMRDLIDRMVLAINQTTTGAPEGRESRAAVPTGGTWKRGHILYDSAPSAVGTVGWICTASGTPGTWEQFGGIGPNPGWRDILGTITTRGVGATDPAWAAIGGSAMSAYNFALNDVCWISFHIPHDYVENSDFYIHVHWLPDGTNANSVKWQFEWMYADGHNQEPFPVASLTTDTAEQTVGGTQYQHYVTESDAQSGTGIEPDGIIYVKTTRITNGATNNADGIFVLQMDVHYQSTNMSTKNRAPDFYT